MARIRTIKPDFFTDEKLAEVSIEARFLFIGLIVHVDCEGRMAYSPKRVSMQVFPCMQVDVLPWLSQLQAQGLIVTYEIDGHHYLSIPNFGKHQHIRASHMVPSSYPPPPSNDSVPCGTASSSVALQQTPSSYSVRSTELELELELNKNNTCIYDGAKSQNPAPLEAPNQKSLSLSDPSPLQIDPSEAVDATQAARIVFEAVGLAGTEQLMLVTDAVRSCLSLRPELKPQDVAEWLVEVWNKYDGMDLGRFKCRVFKFFKSGMWRYNEAKWRLLAVGSDQPPAVSTPGVCRKHPDSGLTQWGTCWQCYTEQYKEKP